MKNILKTIIFAILLISLGSCENDNNNPVVKANGITLRTTTLVTPIVLKRENDNDVVANLEWDESNNGTSTSTNTPDLTYRVEIVEKGSNSDGVLANSGKAITVTKALRTYSLNVGELNKLVNQLPNFKCGQEIVVDIRVKSTLGTGANAFSQYSNPITVAVTGYSTAKQILAFVKDSQSPTNAPKILSSSFDKVDDFEGYMYLEPGNYKFYKPDACGDFSTPAVYGGSGGNLEEGTSAPSINVATAGHYYVTADLTAGALKYTVQYYKAFGIYGLGVKGKSEGVQNAVPMSDDTNSNVWKITFDLFKGKGFKFKSNDWIGDLSGDPLSVPSGAKTISVLGSFSDGILVKAPNLGTSGQIKVPGTDDGTRQQYEIVIDVSKPRNYTYTLTIK